MKKEFIGRDVHGNEMFLYRYNKEVFCDYTRNGKVIKQGHQTVDDEIIRMFSNPHTSGAYIYDEIHRIYGNKL